MHLVLPHIILLKKDFLGVDHSILRFVNVESSICGANTRGKGGRERVEGSWGVAGKTITILESNSDQPVYGPTLKINYDQSRYTSKLKDPKVGPSAASIVIFIIYLFVCLSYHKTMNLSTEPCKFSWMTHRLWKLMILQINTKLTLVLSTAVATQSRNIARTLTEFLNCMSLGKRMAHHCHCAMNIFSPGSLITEGISLGKHYRHGMHSAKCSASLMAKLHDRETQMRCQST